MSALKVALQNIFTTTCWDEHSIQKKRRKTVQSTSSSCCDMMDVDINHHHHHHHDSNTILSSSSSPYVTLSHMLAEHGLPSRFDPLSVDHFMYFEMDGVDTISADLDAHQLLRVLGKDNMQSSSSLFVLEPQQGQNPLHTVCIAMTNTAAAGTQQQQLDSSTTAHFIENIRIILRRAPTLAVYIDQNGHTPFEYLNSISMTIKQQVNDLLVQEGVIQRIVNELSAQTSKRMISTQRMSAIEQVDRYVNLSGLDDAIMESGFSI